MRAWVLWPLLAYLAANMFFVAVAWLAGITTGRPANAADPAPEPRRMGWVFGLAFGLPVSILQAYCDGVRGRDYGGWWFVINLAIAPLLGFLGRHEFGPCSFLMVTTGYVLIALGVPLLYPRDGEKRRSSV